MHFVQWRPAFLQKVKEIKIKISNWATDFIFNFWVFLQQWQLAGFKCRKHGPLCSWPNSCLWPFILFLRQQNYQISCPLLKRQCVQHRWARTLMYTPVPLSVANKTRNWLQNQAITCWSERWTREQKIASLNPSRSGGRIFFSRVNFVYWLLFRVHSTPRVTAVACKRPQSLCQKYRRQVTPKHAYTFDPTKSEWADYAAVQA